MPVEVREGRVVIRPETRWGRGRDAEAWKKAWLDEVYRRARERFPGHGVEKREGEVHVVPSFRDEETLRRIREKALLLLGELGLD